MSVRREDVLRVLSENGVVETHFTTTDVAGWLEVDEYAVRGAVSWLCVAGLIEVAGSARRIDAFGRPYCACTYHWNGKSEIPKVRRNRDERMPQATWDVGCFNILVNAISRRRMA